jgi:hypothetical protein
VEEIVEISWWWKRTILTLDIRELQSRAGLFRSNFSPGPLVPRHLQSSVLRFTERSVSTKCPVLVSNDPYPCWTFLKHIISWRVEAKQVRYAHWEAIHCKHLQTKLLWKQFYLFLRTKQTYVFNSVWTCGTWTPMDQLVISVHFAVYATYMPMESNLFIDSFTVFLGILQPFNNLHSV